MSLELLLWLLAAISFGLAAFKVAFKWVDLFILGWMFVALTFVV